MTLTSESNRAASAREIRHIVGPIDDGAIAGIVAAGATREEVLEAWTWLNSDDYVQRKRHHTLQGRTAMVLDILESELPDPDLA